MNILSFIIRFWKTHIETNISNQIDSKTKPIGSLGLIEEAKITASVLGHNFPDSQWYKDTYQLINNFLQ